MAELTRAPGNNASIGGLKVVAKSGWFAASPSGAEDIYRAKSFVKSWNELMAVIASKSAALEEASQGVCHERACC